MSQATVRRPASAEPAWLSARRLEALERFRTDGFPGPKDEEWRQTSVAPIAARAHISGAGSKPPSTATLMKRYEAPHSDASSSNNGQ